MMSQLDDALAIAGRGFAVFPAMDKRPLPGVMWKDAATTDANQITAWWTANPEAEIAVPLPPRTMAVDVDSAEAAVVFRDEGFINTAAQLTRSGIGAHFFYRTDGRDVPQVVKRGGVSLDTRSAGKGYVIAYDTNAFDLARWSMAPEWVYAQAPADNVTRDASAPMGTRNEILSWLGTFPARGIELSAKQYEVLLRSKRDEGGIVALDPAKPWTDGDLKKLAAEAAKWEVGRLLSAPVLGEAEAEMPEESGLPEPVLPDAALYGPLGNIVKALTPHTEASPASLLATLLVYFSAVAGEGSILYQGGEQAARLFAAVVGPTSLARKGTAMDLAEEVMDLAVPGEVARLSISGAGSGEGLVRTLMLRNRGSDEHKADGRALINEPEFSRFLRAMSWKGSTLSANLCKAWDGKPLEHVNVHERIRAEGNHLCAAVAITREILRKELTDEDAQSGFSNRFLWVWSPVSTVPIAMTTPAREHVAQGDIRAIREAVEWARERMERWNRTDPLVRAGGYPTAWGWSDAAAVLWRENYRQRGDPYGMRQAITARADPQVARLALIYAISDQSPQDGPPWVIEAWHLQAAEAFWSYCRASVERVFGDSTGNRHADALLRVLKREGRVPWLAARNELGMRTADDMDTTVEALRNLNLAHVIAAKREGGGRPERIIVRGPKPSLRRRLRRWWGRPH